MADSKSMQKDRTIVEAETEQLHGLYGPGSKRPVLHQWFIFFKIFRIFGNCPICVYPSHEVPIQFEPLSVISIFSGACFLTRLVVVILHFTTDWSISLIGPGAENQIQDWMMEMTNYLCIPLLYIWELCCTWLTLKKFITLFNNWSRFEMEYSKIFFESEYRRLKYRTFLKPFRRLTCSLSLVLVLCIIAASCFYIQDVGFRSITWNSNIVNLVVKLAIISPSFLEEVKVLMMYLTLTESFSNIRRGIKSQMKTSQETSVEMVSGWKQLIELTRKQVKLTAQIQTPHQLTAILHSVILYTETLFILVKGAIFTKRPLNIAIMFSVMSANHFLRFLAKTVLAQQIREEEMKIADEISRIDIMNLPMSTNIELTKLEHKIRQTPSTISLSGFIVVEKRLVLKMSSYILGYLVVLIQFHLSSDRERGNCDRGSTTT